MQSPQPTHCRTGPFDLGTLARMQSGMRSGNERKRFRLSG